MSAKKELIITKSSLPIWITRPELCSKEDAAQYEYDFTFSWFNLQNFNISDAKTFFAFLFADNHKNNFYDICIRKQKEIHFKHSPELDLKYLIFTYRPHGKERSPNELIPFSKEVLTFIRNPIYSRLISNHWFTSLIEFLLQDLKKYGFFGLYSSITYLFNFVYRIKISLNDQLFPNLHYQELYLPLPLHLNNGETSFVNDPVNFIAIKNLLYITNPTHSYHSPYNIIIWSYVSNIHKEFEKLIAELNETNKITNEEIINYLIPRLMISNDDIEPLISLIPFSKTLFINSLIPNVPDHYKDKFLKIYSFIDQSI